VRLRGSVNGSPLAFLTREAHVADVTNQAIVQYTEEVARQIAHTYEGAPFDELRVWVKIAHQREAMVTQLYGMSQIDARLGQLSEGTAGSVVRAVIASIWAHEESHTRFLGALRSLSESFSGLTELQGKLEGWVTRSAVSGGALARMLIAVGASLDRVPDFAGQLKLMNLRQLVEFDQELETTARMGYARILELVRALAGNEEVEDALGFTFEFDLTKILCEENFHEAVFREMAQWVSADGSTFLPLPREQCAKTLHNLCEQNLSVRTVRRITPAMPKGFQLVDDGWVSDGGLGRLFADFDLSVPIVTVGLTI
jgi:hypothetical protein